MAKYDQLETYLARKGAAEIQLGFADIERIIGQMLPKSAQRPQWWANEIDADSRHVQARAWRNAGYDAFWIKDAEQVRFVRRFVRRQAGDPHTFYVAPERPTDEEIAKARSALENLAKLLASASAQACHKLGIEFDMSDPQVACDVVKATFEGLFSSRRTQPGRKRR